MKVKDYLMLMKPSLSIMVVQQCYCILACTQSGRIPLVNDTLALCKWDADNRQCQCN